MDDRTLRFFLGLAARASDDYYTPEYAALAMFRKDRMPRNSKEVKAEYILDDTWDDEEGDTDPTFKSVVEELVDDILDFDE
jgi:hypothetical protein